MVDVKLAQLRVRLLTVLLIAAPFSLYPFLPLARLNFPSFRLGAYQLVALAFACLCLPLLLRTLRTVERPVLVAGTALVVSILVGVILAVDNSRGLLMGASMMLVLLVGLGGLALARDVRWQAVGDYMISASFFYAAATVVQLVVATATSANVLLCRGCGEAVFGFVRINGFAAEPLFWANALMPFWVVSAVRSYTQPRKRHYAALLVNTLSICLTFARGAYIALFFASCVLGGFALYQKKLRAAVRVCSLIGIGFVLGWAMLTTSAWREYPDRSVRVTLEGMVEHLSLGRVMLKAAPPVCQGTCPLAEEATPTVVEASQNERTSAAQLALKAWIKTPRYLLFGVGPGQLGPTVVRDIDPQAPSNLTVYIFYVLLLSELGLVGLAGFAALVIAALRSAWLARSLTFGLIILTFTLHFVFFGSYINAIYIWLWVGLVIGVTHRKAKKGGTIAL